MKLWKKLAARAADIALTLGGALVALGVGLISLPGGLVTAGALLILAGILLAKDPAGGDGV